MSREFPIRLSIDPCSELNVAELLLLPFDTRGSRWDIEGTRESINTGAYNAYRNVEYPFKSPLVLFHDKNRMLIDLRLYVRLSATLGKHKLIRIAFYAYHRTMKFLGAEERSDCIHFVIH